MHQLSNRLIHLSSSILVALTIVVLFSCSSGGGDPYAHLATAIDCVNKADAIMDQAGSTISKEDSKKIDNFYRTALKEAKRIDFTSMNKDYATLGDRCKGELKKSLEWILEGDRKNDLRIQAAGVVLLARFIEWYQSIKDEIRKSSVIDK